MYKISEVINKRTEFQVAHFDCYREGKLFYIIKEYDTPLWQFEVDVTDTDDIGSAAFGAVYKPITLMRYIRKSIEKGNLIKLTQ